MGWKIFVLFFALIFISVKSQPIEVFGYEVEPIELRSVEECMIGCNAPIYTSWLYYIITIAAAVFAVISIIFMFGRMIHKPEYEALAKLELWKTFNALIWVFIIILPFIAFTCRATCYVAKGNPYEISQDYIQNVKEKIEENIEKLIKRSKEVRLPGGIQVLIPPGTSCFTGVCISPLAGCTALADTYETTAFFLYPFLGSLVVQQLALITFPILFSLLLPIGLILRIIPRFREAGAFVIAVALSIFIVFPLTYVFAKKATNAAINQIPSPPHYHDIQCTYFNLIGGSGLRDFLNILYDIGKILPQAVFFPAFSTLLTVFSARVMSKIFLYDFVGE